MLNIARCSPWYGNPNDMEFTDKTLAEYTVPPILSSRW